MCLCPAQQVDWNTYPVTSRGTLNRNDEHPFKQAGLHYGIVIKSHHPRTAPTLRGVRSPPSAPSLDTIPSPLRLSRGTSYGNPARLGPPTPPSCCQYPTIGRLLRCRPPSRPFPCSPPSLLSNPDKRHKTQATTADLASVSQQRPCPSPTRLLHPNRPILGSLVGLIVADADADAGARQPDAASPRPRSAPRPRLS